MALSYAAAPPRAGEAPAGDSWTTAKGVLSLDRPRIMGVLNVTPDSFWDGGRHNGVDAALRHVDGLLDEGADIIDVGGESTRPGATAVEAGEEARRVVPVVREIVRRWPELLVSVDTVKASVADAALAEGAAVINDVSGLRLDPKLGAVIASAGAGVVLMHSRGGSHEMASYELARYGVDMVSEVLVELKDAVARALRAGLRGSTLVLDPGLGFAKRSLHSAAVLRELKQVSALGYPVLIGPSRKRFLGEMVGGLAVDDRLEAGIAACVLAFVNGARIFRVHDVGAARRALDFTHAALFAS